MEHSVGPDDYVVVQRQKFMKIHRLGSKRLECRLGQDTVDLSSIIGQPFSTTYKMELKANSKRIYSLTKCQTHETLSDIIMNATESGVDNRNINDDGSSQKLSTAEIINLRKSGKSAVAIVESLVENSKTFASKTEYAQEKYLKKKEKKYLEQIIIKKPTFRVVAECILSKGPAKTLGLRMDSLSQITSLANVRYGGKFMVYETGCQGLVLAAVLNSIGSEGNIIHVHSGHNPEKHAVLHMNPLPNRLDQILSISIQSIGSKVNHPEKAKVEKCSAVTEVVEGSEIGDGEPDRKRPRWEIREDKAIYALQDSYVDGLIVVGREHPTNILCQLLRYLHPSRSFVVFCAMREPLQQLFLELKPRSDVTAMRLTESWLRYYQVQTDRTHPDINMSGSSGFLLSGVKVTS